MIATLLYRIVPPMAGLFGWYSLSTFFQEAAAQSSVAEHADWIMGIMGGIITFGLGLIGYLSSKAMSRIEADISQLRTEVHEIANKVNSHAEDIAVLNTTHNNRRKKR